MIRAGLIGAGIQASRTPQLHINEGQAHGLAYAYELIDLEDLGAGVDALPGLLAEAESKGFAGLNITHPCKQAILPWLDELSLEAATIGAVNTVIFLNGKRLGHNTDWWGFAESFQRGLPDVPLQQVVLLGAGGAGAALAYAAYRLGVERLMIFDVDRSRAEHLAAHCNERLYRDFAVATADLAASIAEADGLMQATPVGMFGHPGLPVAPELLHPQLWVSEVIYTPLETELLRHAKQLGCQVLNAAGMTVFQAVKAFELFTGLPADPVRMLRHFDSLLSSAKVR